MSPSGRYEVLIEESEQTGMIAELFETFPKRHDAFSCAARVATKVGSSTFVFDSMARRGKPNGWSITPGLNPNKVIVVPPASCRSRRGP